MAVSRSTQSLRHKTIPTLTLKPKVSKPLLPKKEKEKAVDLYSMPRPFVVTLYDRKKHALRTYHYKWLDTALAKSITRARRMKPGEVIEIAHTVTGNQVGTIKVRVNGHLDVDGLWDDY